MWVQQTASEKTNIMTLKGLVWPYFQQRRVGMHTDQHLRMLWYHSIFSQEALMRELLKNLTALRWMSKNVKRCLSPSLLETPSSLFYFFNCSLLRPPFHSFYLHSSKNYENSSKLTNEVQSAAVIPRVQCSQDTTSGLHTHSITCTQCPTAHTALCLLALSTSWAVVIRGHEKTVLDHQHTHTVSPHL